ncbi:MAG: DNA polymerase III subunit gamma/tau, partial [Glaciimonas sp.]|nr:DNA polymerase III subunit gamma/tau [Glaciimonas sp.]
RKYRPRSFETLVGQEHVVRALTHALEQQRLHHAYLFTGTRGVGKTTLSRILAKALNCHGIDGNGGITAQPCGVCDACVAIDAGRFVDYIEMDAASNRGIEEMAQLLEQAVYAPSNARFKVYMIDEVHMLTNHAFNAMLKTLEEPPDHVKFILATTDPQKIPVTVLSRCLQFNLKQMPPGYIISHLDNILGKEQIAFETPALRLLAQGAHGSMRDALSLTDQAIAYAAGKVTLEAVQGMLGSLDQTYLIRVLDALALKDGTSLLAVADEITIRSLSYSAALQDLGTLLHRIALAQSVPSALAEDLPEREDVLRLAAAFDSEEIQLFYQIVVHGRNELGLAPDEYAGFSMTLLRMLAFRPQSGDDAVAALQQSPPAAPSRPSPPTPITAKALTLPSPPAARLSSAPQVATASAPIARVDETLSPRMAALAAARGSFLGKRPATNPPMQSLVQRAPATIVAPESKPAVTFRVQPEMDKAAVKTVAPTIAPPPMASALPWEEEIPLPTDLPDNDAPESAYNNRFNVRSDARPVVRAETRSVARPMVRSEPPVEMRASSMPSKPTALLTMDAPRQSPQAPMDPFIYQPDPSLDWDGNWPTLAAALPVRGITHQLAQQSELLRFDSSGPKLQIHLRIPLETLRSSGNVDKLTTALAVRFGWAVQVETEIGKVHHTSNVMAQTVQAERQRIAEETARNDPFILSMMHEFDATILPGSIKSLA